MKGAPQAYLQVEGSGSEKITLDGGDVSSANLVKYAASASNGTVKVRA
jgi:hypothetical protein